MVRGIGDCNSIKRSLRESDAAATLLQTVLCQAGNSQHRLVSTTISGASVALSTPTYAVLHQPVNVLRHVPYGNCPHAKCAEGN
jgi:hypothetical protein